jgi:hypothetical protein
MQGGGAPKTARTSTRLKNRGKKYVAEAVRGEVWNDEAKRFEVEVKWVDHDEWEYNGKEELVKQIGMPMFEKLLKNGCV